MSMQKAYTVCKEMLLARQYTIIDESIDEIICKKSNNTFLVVYFLHYSKLNTGTLQYYYKKIQENNYKHCIMVHKLGVTSSVKKNIVLIPGIKFECFHVTTLQFNITKHELVPLHTLADKSKHTEANKYPIIKSTDPVVRFYGFTKGSILQIHRKNNTVYFRLVQ